MKQREFYILEEFNSNRALTRTGGEKWPDDVNGEPSDKWKKVREISPELDAAILGMEKALEYISEMKDFAPMMAPDEAIKALNAYRKAMGHE